jgi:transposase
MIRDLRGERLPEWIESVRADDLPALHSFTTGLRHDLAAVTAGLPCLGATAPPRARQRVKMLERQCFGRAKLDLLRKRILLTTCRR